MMKIALVGIFSATLLGSPDSDPHRQDMPPRERLEIVKDGITVRGPLVSVRSALVRDDKLHSGFRIERSIEVAIDVSGPSRIYRMRRIPQLVECRTADGSDLASVLRLDGQTMATPNGWTEWGWPGERTRVFTLYYRNNELDRLPIEFENIALQTTVEVATEIEEIDTPLAPSDDFVEVADGVEVQIVSVTRHERGSASVLVRARATGPQAERVEIGRLEFLNEAGRDVGSVSNFVVTDLADHSTYEMVATRRLNHLASPQTLRLYVVREIESHNLELQSGRIDLGG